MAFTNYNQIYNDLYNQLLQSPTHEIRPLEPTPDTGPSPSSASQPAPTALPNAPTPIDPKELADILYGQPIPAAVGDNLTFGGKIIEGPETKVIDGETCASWISGYYIPMNYYQDTRTVTQLLFRGKLAWDSTDGALLANLNVGGATIGNEQRVRFTTGTLTQAPDAWSVSKYDDRAVAYVPLVTATFENIRLSQFGNVYPFTSVTVQDTAFGVPGDGITWSDALEAVALFDGRTSSEFKTSNISGLIGASGGGGLIFGTSPFYFPDFVNGMRKLKPQWFIRSTGTQMIIVEKSAFTLDATITRDQLKRGSPLIIHYGDQYDKPAEKIANFIDSERDLQPNAVRWAEDLEPVVVTDSYASDNFNVPIATDSATMVADLAYAFYSEQMARETSEMTTLAWHMKREVGDSIQITTDEITYFHHINEISRKVDGTMDIKSSAFLTCALSGQTVATLVDSQKLSRSNGDFSGVPLTGIQLGDPAADRLIILLITHIRPTVPASSILSVTINGSAATIHGSVSDSTISTGIGGSNGSPTLTIASLVVPSGDTADLAITYDDEGLAVGAGILYLDVHRLTGYGSATPTDIQSDVVVQGDQNPTVTLGCVDPSTVFALWCGSAGTVSPPTFTGVDVTDSDRVITEWPHCRTASGHQSLVGTGGRTISCSSNMTINSLIAAAWT